MKRSFENTDKKTKQNEIKKKNNPELANDITLTLNQREDYKKEQSIRLIIMQKVPKTN